MTPTRSPEPAKLPGGARVAPKAFLLLHVTLLLYAVVTLVGKYAANSLAARQTTPFLLFLALEFIALAVYAVLWQQTLRRMPLSFAYSNKAVCMLWSCLFGLVFFQETLTWGKAAGILVALAGVWLVVSEHD